ncbi:hypothetical protein WBG06_14860 [Nocardioides sp. CCNWLW239]|uniref:hypothetical protein n=1 Tax=Nocardioides sp. CCNWLW239 TaxID=3128902 RepID=UPI003015D812
MTDETARAVGRQQIAERMIERELEAAVDEAVRSASIAQDLRAWIIDRMNDDAARMITATAPEIDAYVPVHFDFVTTYGEDPLAGKREPGLDLPVDLRIEAAADIRKLNQRYSAWVRRLLLRVEDEIYELIGEWYDDDGDRLELSSASAHDVISMTEPEGVARLGSVRAFREFCDDHPYATIGLAGPRGCGKSTILENRPDPSLPPRSDRVRVNVSAPVKYETQAFLLHLFAEVCRAVVGYRYPAFSNDFPRIRIAFPFGRVVPYAVLGVFAYAVAYALARGWKTGPGAPIREMSGDLAAWWHWMWQPKGDPLLEAPGLDPVSLLVVVAAFCLAVAVRRSLRWVLVTRRDVPVLVKTARRHIETIRTIQTATAGMNGEVGVAGVKLVANRSVERATREWTPPELVGELRRFLWEVHEEDLRMSGSVVHSEPSLRMIASGVLWRLADLIGGIEDEPSTAGQTYRVPPLDPGVVITIDELDKIETVVDAQQFVNEIKSIFGAPGTQVIVSVSEDALNSFELRGLPMRDAFDSAFKHVFRIDYLSISDTRRILERMDMVWLSKPFVWLVYLLSGGLPRDVARVGAHLNAVARENPGARLHTVAQRLVAQDLAQRLTAFERTCGGKLQAYDATAAPAEAMPEPAILHVIREIRRVARDGRLLSATELVDRAAAIRGIEGGGTFASQVASYLCYCESVLEILDVEALEKETEEYEKLLPTLARARQSMAVHPDLAMELIDEFRAAWGLEALDTR